MGQYILVDGIIMIKEVEMAFSIGWMDPNILVNGKMI